MAKSEMKSGANIGSASLILIFIVLCLGTFGLLSLTSAKNDLDLAERNGASVSGYYQADGEGEAFRLAMEQLAAEAVRQNPSHPEDYIKESLTEGYLPEEQAVEREIPMESGQALLIKLGFCWDNEEERTQVLQWMVYNREEYEIDQDMPVWSGE